MELFVPFMLFVFGLHPDGGGEIDFSRPEIMFESAAACEEAGAAMAARMTQADENGGGIRYQFRCLPVPSPAEYDAAFEPVKQRLEERNRQRDQKQGQ